MSVHEEITQARAERKEGRPYLVDRALIDLAFSLPRDEWNATAGAMIEEHGGRLNFRIHSDGTFAIGGVGAMGGLAFVQLEDVMLGPVWVKPRALHAPPWNSGSVPAIGGPKKPGRSIEAVKDAERPVIVAGQSHWEPTK